MKNGKRFITLIAILFILLPVLCWPQAGRAQGPVIEDAGQASPTGPFEELSSGATISPEAPVTPSRAFSGGPVYDSGWVNLAQGESRTDIPGDKLLLELFKHTPSALVLDEFQTWYDGLTNTNQFPWRTWAFNFIQLLSDIAKEHPELLVLVVSVRNGETDAYQQIHRVNPRQIDFKGPNARRDRLRLLLHRLFDNRMQVPETQIAAAIAAHVSEHLRLADVAPAEHDRVRKEFVEAWPFAPHLMTLLEDQVLVATQAQETRDLIRILADVFKSRSVASPIITAADFRLDDEKSGIAALLDSVSNQHHAHLL